MTRFSSRSFRIMVAAILFCLAPVSAFAYIDPGTGSFVIQGIIAAVVGAGVAIKMFWHRIIGVFGKKPDLEDEDSDD